MQLSKLTYEVGICLCW